MEDNTKRLIEIINENMSNGRLVLGIDGLSRAGKTTLVGNLQKELQEKEVPFMIYHIDDHIVERSKRYNTGQEEWVEYYSLQWDIEELKHHFFGKLKVEDSITLSYYDKESDSHELRTVHLPEKCIIIVEGVFLQRKDWRDYFDLIVFLDSQQEVRLQREGIETQEDKLKLINRYWKAEDYYMQTVRPKEKADFILLGS